MKITVASKKETWYTKELLDAANALNIDLSVKNISVLSDADDLGDILYWRSSSIESDYPTVAQRSRLLLEAQKNGVTIINHALLTNPYLTYKSYQQSFVASQLSHINTIPTFTAKNQSELREIVTQNKLSLPLIAKPDHGSQGSDIFLIEKLEDISKITNVSSYIFQNYIHNTGDYRVYVIGGVGVEVIKRTSPEDKYLNNISQGGTAQRVADIDEREELSSLATQIASALDLSICGVDLIYDAKIKKYVFLEVNTVAQWKGLQSVSNINIAQKIIRYLHTIALQKNNDTSIHEMVSTYYKNNLEYLSREKQFHFASRLLLFNKDTKQEKILQGLKEWYMWDEQSIEKSVSNLYKHSEELFKTKIINQKKFREPYTDKYPLLGFCNDVLYKTLFTKTIYNNDLRPVVKEHVDIAEIQSYQERLWNDEPAIIDLSTHAINFLYLSQWFLDGNIDVDAQKLYQIAKRQNVKEDPDTLLSQIYLLTHCIICASLFYSNAIDGEKKNVYTEIVKLLETIIAENYVDISIDQKCEFLVCTKILQHETRLKKTIDHEAQRSLSPHGNFLIDSYNIHKNSVKKDMSLSEHRNILYILSK
jgi:RimK family alpha-L-glutamate ligase